MKGVPKAPYTHVSLKARKQKFQFGKEKRRGGRRRASMRQYKPSLREHVKSVREKRMAPRQAVSTRRPWHVLPSPAKGRAALKAAAPPKIVSTPYKPMGPSQAKKWWGKKVSKFMSAFRPGAITNIHQQKRLRQVTGSEAKTYK